MIGIYHISLCRPTGRLHAPMAELADALVLGSSVHDVQVRTLLGAYIIGVSPSGKVQDFDSCIRWFESGYPNQSPQAGLYACIYAQMAKLADAAVSKAAAVRRCGFDPRSGHHKCRSVWQKACGAGGRCCHGKGWWRCRIYSAAP